eukprot:279843-Amphidinium_carterae.2
MRGGARPGLAEEMCNRERISVQLGCWRKSAKPGRILSNLILFCKYHSHNTLHCKKNNDNMSQGGLMHIWGSHSNQRDRVFPSSVRVP